MKSNRCKKIIITFLVYITLGLAIFTRRVEAAESSFWIEFIDVGQGDAALVQCDGHYMLIDGGPSDASQTIYTILKNKEVKKLDYMIATHQDADHIGGLSAALNYATVQTCYSPVTTYDSRTFFNLLRYLAKNKASLTIPKCGAVFKLGSAKVEILGPVRMGKEANNDSIVTRITYGDTSFLLMGDAECEEEYDIIDEFSDISCDLIKIGHHGSSHSTSGDLLDLANPVYAVISVGKNSYGHPTKETLKRLKKKKITVFRTDKDGDITVSSDGTNLFFDTEKKRK